MGTNSESRRELNDKLYDLLKIKLEAKDMKLRSLDEAINKTKSIMTKEDVAWVEKTIAELNV